MSITKILMTIPTGARQLERSIHVEGTVTTSKETHRICGGRPPDDIEPRGGMMANEMHRPLLCKLLDLHCALRSAGAKKKASRRLETIVDGLQAGTMGFDRRRACLRCENLALRLVSLHRCVRTGREETRWRQR
jgi:hypothetical protein